MAFEIKGLGRNEKFEIPVGAREVEVVGDLQGGSSLVGRAGKNQELQVHIKGAMLPGSCAMLTGPKASLQVDKVIDGARLLLDSCSLLVGGRGRTHEYTHVHVRGACGALTLQTARDMMIWVEPDTRLTTKVRVGQREYSVPRRGNDWFPHLLPGDEVPMPPKGRFVSGDRHWQEYEEAVGKYLQDLRHLVFKQCVFCQEWLRRRR